MTDTKKPEPQVLRDVKVPEFFYERIDLGDKILNEIFGGPDFPGVPKGVTILFTGSPGAGKSTLALQIADLMTASGMSVLYNLGEEDKNMVKMRADRLGIKGNFCVHTISEVDELFMFCLENGVDVLIQDSLQSLGDGQLAGKALLKSVVGKMNVLKTINNNKLITPLIIGHITKGGTFAGPMEIKHDVDVHAHMKINLDNGNRIIELEKNRRGPATIPYEFAISSKGLAFKATTDDEPKPKAVEKREEVRDIAKAKLLAGEKLSGYCFDRLGLDVSGGFWRGMVAKAKEELSREGHEMVEEKINGRTFVYIKAK